MSLGLSYFDSLKMQNKTLYCEHKHPYMCTGKMRLPLSDGLKSELNKSII